MKPYEKNARKITDAQLADLETWLDELGDLGGIVHDLNSDQIIGGNQRSRVFNINDCEIHIADKKRRADRQGTIAQGWVIWRGHRFAYRQVRWTEDQAAKANIIANKAGGAFDMNLLAVYNDPDDLLHWGFSREELMGKAFNFDEGRDAEPQMDQADQLRKKWRTRPGQIWRIGDHRLICGDCTDPATIARVMDQELANLLFTSPPYWVGKDYETQKTEAEIDAFIANCVQAWTDHVSRDLGRICINTGTSPIHRIEKKRKVEVLPLIDKWQTHLRARGWLARHWRVWVKGGDLPASISPRTDVVDQHWENIVTFDTDQFTGEEFSYIGTWWAPDGDQRGQEKLGTKWVQQGVWNDIPGQRRGEGNHVAAFPVELPRRLVMTYTREDEIVLEPFLGSGSSMVACQNLRRRCRASELDAKYIAVSLQRMADAFPELEIELIK